MRDIVLFAVGAFDHLAILVLEDGAFLALKLLDLRRVR